MSVDALFTSDVSKVAVPAVASKTKVADFVFATGFVWSVAVTSNVVVVEFVPSVAVNVTVCAVPLTNAVVLIGDCEIVTTDKQLSATV